MDRNIFQSCRSPQKTFHPDSHVAGIGMDGAGRHHGGLLLQHLVNIRRIQSERGQLVLVHFHINHLLLYAQELHLLHVRHQHQLTADIFRIPALFLIAVIIAGQSVNRAVHIIKAVVNHRPYDAGRHIAPHIGNGVSHIVPALLHFRCRHFILQVHINNRLPVMGEGLDIVQALGVLELPLQRIGDLVSNLLCRRPRPGSCHHHFTDCEIRIFTASQPEIGKYTANDNGNDEEINNLSMADGPFRQIQPFHVLTSSPSDSLEAPAETMRSPRERPPVISTVSSPYRPTVTGTR